MSLLWPWFLLLLILLPLLVLAYWWMLRRKRHTVRFRACHWRAALPKQSLWRRHLPLPCY